MYPRTTFAYGGAAIAAGCLCAAVASSVATDATGLRRRRGALTKSAAGSNSVDAQQQDEQQLGNLWAAVVEVMLCEAVAGEDVFLVPAEPGAAPPSELQPLPPLLQTHTIFALTAFDPPGA